MERDLTGPGPGDGAPTGETRMAGANGPVLEMGAPVERRRDRGGVTGIAVVGAIVVTGALAFASGHRDRPVPAPTPFHGEVDWGSGSCLSTDQGRTVIGLSITNHSTDPATVIDPRVTLPKGAHMLGSTWTECVAGTGTAGSVLVPPGATVWLSVTADRVTACPSSVPVFAASYVLDRRTFPLDPVPYGSCG